MLTRRAFLGTSVSALGGFALSPSALAAARRTPAFSERILVVIELRGGLDGLAALQPLDDARLLRARPTLAKAENQLQRVGDDCGLHPRLSKLAARFKEGGVGIWRSVGHDKPNLSHFESQDFWNEGRVADVRSGIGWLGGFGETLGPDPLSMLAIGDGALPGALRGPSRRPPAVRGLTGLSLRGPDGDLGRARVAAIEKLLHAESDGAEREFLARASLVTHDAGRRLEAAESYRPKNDWPRSRLSNDLAAVAAVIDAGIPTRVFHVVQNGYDTHADQTASLERLLGELDGALDAFLTLQGRQHRLEDVLVMTTSEFGRRVAESGDGGSAGTDHGTAGVLFFAGGRTQSGVFGARPDLEQLDAAGNYAANVDFRRLYAGVLSGWLGGDAAGLLGPEFPPLEVVRA